MSLDSTGSVVVVVAVAFDGSATVAASVVPDDFFSDAGSETEADFLFFFFTFLVCFFACLSMSFTIT